MLATRLLRVDRMGRTSVEQQDDEHGLQERHSPLQRIRRERNGEIETHGQHPGQRALHGDFPRVPLCFVGFHRVSSARTEYTRR